MKKNLVVIGYGGMGSWHVNHAVTSDVVNLLGVYDIKEERNELARERGIFAYRSFEEVLSDERVDIITVAIPNDAHKEVVIRALEAGKNVICEKPVALSLDELDEMINTAKKCDRIFSVHQNRRFDTDFLAIKNIKESGEIGRLINIESRIHGSRGIPGDWRGKTEHGGGMLLDWGVHLIDQLLQIMDSSLKKVYCEFDNITNLEVDDGIKLSMMFENGTRAFVEVGTYNFINMPRFYMRATEGTAIITEWTEKARVVKCTNMNESNVVPVVTAAGLTKTMAPRTDATTQSYVIEQPESDVHDYYRNFVKAIDRTETQLVTHSQMRRVMKVMMAAFESARLGQAVAFDDENN